MKEQSGEPILYRYSRHAALLGGILVPLLESIRRWGNGDHLFWIDDYLIGAFLLVAAWQARRGPAVGRPWLAAAWAFACGIGYSSLLGHWLSLDLPDVGHFDHRLLTAAIALGLMLALLALYGALRGAPEK